MNSKEDKRGIGTKFVKSKVHVPIILINLNIKLSLFSAILTNFSMKLLFE